MNILNKLTLKHLKMNKKRTLVTIIGITLSTALMVGIGLLISTVLTTERLATERSHGAHHFTITELSKENYQTLEKNIKIDSMYYYSGIGFVSLENSSNPFRPYLYVTEASSNLLEKLNIIEGRLPEKDNEIVLTKEAIEDGNLKVKVGETISLNIGKRYYNGEYLGNTNIPIPRYEDSDDIIKNAETLEDTKIKEYKVVGIIERTYYEDYESAGYMSFTLSRDIPSEVEAFIKLKKPKETYETIKEIASNININENNFNANTSLLFYYGATKYDNINSTFLPLILIALSVISVGCIVVIYNSFAISTMERKKSFGLYSSIGTTGKQIRKTVLFEAFIVGSIGIILGILGGFLGIYVVVEILNYLLKDAVNMEFIFSVNLTYLLIPLIFMCMVILLSAYLPAKRAGKVTPIEAIRGNDDIKVTRKSLKTPKIISAIFGIEGELAHKNMKRNKKKYRVTIISLFISIVMFNTFTSFLGYAIKTSDSVDSSDYDIGFYLKGKKEDIKEDIKVIKSNYEIKEERTIIQNEYITVNKIDDNEYTTLWKNMNSDYPEEAKSSFELIVIPDSDMTKLTKAEGLILNKKYLTIYEENSRKTIETDIFKNKNYNLEIVTDNSTFNIEAETTNDIDFGFKTRLYTGRPTLIISESTYESKFSSDNYESEYLFNSKDYKKINEDYKNNKLNLKSEVQVYSPKIEEATIKNIVLAINILFYGFIALVVLIGVTSVINTINTSMNLRRKEFAMLRSVGLTPHGFNKILFFESLFFGLKSLIYGIPVSIGINALISKSIGRVFNTGMIIPWDSLIISVIGVFIIVIIAMNYASKKIKKENILEALREENI